MKKALLQVLILSIPLTFNSGNATDVSEKMKVSPIKNTSNQFCGLKDWT